LTITGIIQVASLEYSSSFQSYLRQIDINVEQLERLLKSFVATLRLTEIAPFEFPYFLRTAIEQAVPRSDLVIFS